MNFQAGAPSYERSLADEVAKSEARRKREARLRRKARKGTDPVAIVTKRRKSGPKPKGRKCGLDGCQRKHYALDLCNAHWKAARRNNGLRD